MTIRSRSRSRTADSDAAANSDSTRTRVFNTTVRRVAVVVVGVGLGVGLLAQPTSDNKINKIPVPIKKVQSSSVGISAVGQVPTTGSIGNFCRADVVSCVYERPKLLASGIVGYAEIEAIKVSSDFTDKGKFIRRQHDASLQLNSNIIVRVGNTPEYPWLQNVVEFDTANSTLSFHSSIFYTPQEQLSFSGKGNYTVGKAATGYYYQFDTESVKYHGNTAIYLSIDTPDSNVPLIKFGYLLKTNGKTSSAIYDTVRIYSHSLTPPDPSIVVAPVNPFTYLPESNVDLVFAGPWDGERAVFSNIRAYLGLYDGTSVGNYSPLNAVFRDGNTGETASNAESVTHQNTYAYVKTGKQGSDSLRYNNPPIAPLLRDKSHVTEKVFGTPNENW